MTKQESREQSRRNFLKSLGKAGLVGSMLLHSGCDSDKSAGSFEIVSQNEPKTFWEKVTEYIDNTLEGGFSFDFRDIRNQGITFQDITTINGDDYALDAQGYTLNSVFDNRERKFMITSLKRNDRGFSLDLMEGNTYLKFRMRDETQNLTFGSKQYIVTLNELLLSEDNIIPMISLTVNGEINLIREKGRAGELNFNLNLKDYLHNGNISLFVSPHHFYSGVHSRTDTLFSGLEHLINQESRPRKEINAHSYNGQIQEDAYFRINADFCQDRSKKLIILNAAGKIRIPDSKLEDYPSLPNQAPSVYEVKGRIDEDQYQIISHVSNANREFTEDFIFEFSPPLEARIDIPQDDISLLPELFNTEFKNEDNVKFLIRHIAFDSRKIPNTSHPSNINSKLYPPINGFLTEILESPQEVALEIGVPKDVQLNDAIYTILLKDIKGRGNIFPCFDFIIEASYAGKKEEILIKPLTHGYPNRTSGIQELKIEPINIDPEISQYFGQGSSIVEELSSHIFFISRNKFSSTLEFGDKRFSGLKKILIPDYESAFGSFDTPLQDIVDYKQVTLANRLNGYVTDSGFRAEIEFGLAYYKSGENPNSNSYFTVTSAGFSLSEQIRNRYILRIKAIEKVSLGRPV